MRALSTTALTLLGTPWTIILPALSSSFAVFFCRQTFHGYSSGLSDTARQDRVDATSDVENISGRDGEKRTATLSVPVSSLAYFDESEDDFVLEPLKYESIAAQHSANTGAPSAHIRLGQCS